MMTMTTTMNFPTLILFIVKNKYKIKKKEKCFARNSQPNRCHGMENKISIFYFDYYVVIALKGILQLLYGTFCFSVLHVSAFSPGVRTYEWTEEKKKKNCRMFSAWKADKEHNEKKKKKTTRTRIAHVSVKDFDLVVLHCYYSFTHYFWLFLAFVQILILKLNLLNEKLSDNEWNWILEHNRNNNNKKKNYKHRIEIT